MPPIAVRIAVYLLEANARLAKTATEYAPEPKPSSKSSELGNNRNSRVIVEWNREWGGKRPECKHAWAWDVWLANALVTGRVNWSEVTVSMERLGHMWAVR